ncbi:MAG: crosslink repair DNA glycosylase YcaQ family protein, partial [Brachybacterium sp.]|nr:crosslink repair DNA glycosylase YcaQ family protein [Brachybacterium sp.]
MSVPDLSWRAARRIALRSQGLHRQRAEEMPSRRASANALARTLRHTHLLQIDSVSVFARAHHLPVYSRTGLWDVGALARAVEPHRADRLRESLAHEAAFVPAEVHELLAFRRARAATRDWGAVRRAAEEAPGLLEAVLGAVQSHGPVSAAAVSQLLGDANRPEDGWGWRRTRTQWMVEYLFRAGRIDCVGRSPQFERLYALHRDDATG